jgi:hypothetical protein
MDDDRVVEELERVQTRVNGTAAFFYMHLMSPPLSRVQLPSRTSSADPMTR